MRHSKYSGQLGFIVPNIHVTLDHFPITLEISCHFGQCHKRPCFLLVISILYPQAFIKNLVLKVNYTLGISFPHVTSMLLYIILYLGIYKWKVCHIVGCIPIQPSTLHGNHIISIAMPIRSNGFKDC